jgi:hypothetical protein
LTVQHYDVGNDLVIFVDFIVAIVTNGVFSKPRDVLLGQSLLALIHESSAAQHGLKFLEVVRKYSVEMKTGLDLYG